MALPDAMTNFGAVTLPYTVQTTDLQPFTDNINYLAKTIGSTTSWTLGTFASVSAAWNVMALSALQSGSNPLGITYASGLFTLPVGTWVVTLVTEFLASITHESALTSSTSITPTTAGATTWANGSWGISAGETRGTLTAVVPSTGTSTVAGWWIPSTATTPSSVGFLPRISFTWFPG